MWPLDRAGPKECLRIGCCAIERWVDVEGGLSMLAEHRLEPRAVDRPRSLTEGIGGLYSTPPVGPVTLIVESAWLPITLVDTGAAVLRAAQVQALVRHRFGLNHTDARDPVAQWELRVEGRAGSGRALAYGLSLRTKQAMLDAGEAVGVKWSALLPAFSWGWARLRSERLWPHADAWWLWPEQDRTLVARVHRDDVIGLDPGARCVDGVDDVLRLIEAGAVRFGEAPIASPIVVARWNSSARLPGEVGRVRWLDLRGAATVDRPDVGAVARAAP